MITLPIAQAIFDSMDKPLVFVDNEHQIRFCNRAAIETYCAKRGWATLEGRSIFDCHGAASKVRIIALHARLLAGEDQIQLKINSRNEAVTLVAVRATDRTLLGYYERFSVPV